MARVNNLTNFLNDVATAIKQKLGDNTPIPASQFDTKIGEIETGGNYQTKSISITTNGNYTQLPDTGFDAMDQVVISVNVPAPDLSDATAQPKDILLGKTAYNGNGKQTGTFYGAQLFETYEAMQQNTDATEGDLACVYKTVIVSAQPGDVLGERTFLPEITLDTAVTSNIDIRWHNHYMIEGGLTPTTFWIRSQRGGHDGTVWYLSEDGIHYTIGDTSPTTYSFSNYDRIPNGTDLRVCAFFSAESKEFLGLYKYALNQYDTATVRFPNLVKTNRTDASTVTYTNVYDKAIIQDLRDKAIEQFSNSIYYMYLFLGTDNNWYLINSDTNTSLAICYVGDGQPFNGLGLINLQSSSDSYIKTFNVYRYDDANGEYVSYSTFTTNETSTRPGYSSFSAYSSAINSLVSTYPIPLSYLFNTTYNVDMTTNIGSNGINVTLQRQINMYIPAETQFTLSAANELLPGKIAYGQNGVVTGDGTIYDNITPVTLDTSGSILTSTKFMSVNGIQNKSVFIKQAQNYTTNEAPVNEYLFTPFNPIPGVTINSVMSLKTYNVYVDTNDTFYVCNLNNNLLYTQTISPSLYNHYYCTTSSLKYTRLDDTFMYYENSNASDIILFNVTSTEITYTKLLSSNSITSANKYFGIYYKNNSGYLCLQTSSTVFNVYRITGTTLTLLTTISVSHSEKYVSMCEDNDYLYFSLYWNSYATLFCINKSTNAVSTIAATGNTSKKLLFNDDTCYMLTDRDVYTVSGTTSTSTGVSINDDLYQSNSVNLIYIPVIQKLINFFPDIIYTSTGQLMIFNLYNLSDLNFGSGGTSSISYKYSFSGGIYSNKVIISDKNNNRYVMDYKINFVKTIDNTSGDNYCGRVGSTNNLSGLNCSTYIEFEKPEFNSHLHSGD